jgi:hypothetical protein
MNVHLIYQSGQSYSERLTNFDAKITRNNGKRVHISFREKQTGKGYASFSLPFDKAQQLAHAILTASTGDVKPIEFTVDESVGTKSVAA